MSSLSSSRTTGFASSERRSPTRGGSRSSRRWTVRGLIVFRPDRVIVTRNGRGQLRDWVRHRPFAVGLRRLADRLPILWNGTVLDRELVAERFAGTMAALQGSARHGDALRVHVFDVLLLAGIDLR